MRHNFFISANPGAGLGSSPLVERVMTSLREAGAQIDCFWPKDIEAARLAVGEAAASGRYDAIVAAGGDGTIRQVAAALLGTDIPLCIVPVGTGNVLAHEIGLAPNAEAIAHMLLHGQSVTINCALANNEPFLLMAGAGFDGRVIAALDHRFKSMVGKAAYAGPVLGALVRPIDRLAVTVDGQHHEASWAVIANAGHYGGSFVLTPHTGIQQRGLQAVLFKAKNRSVLMGQMLSLVMGRLDQRSTDRGDVEMLDCTSATITAHHPVPAQVDGDAFGTTPLVIEAGSDQLQFILPPQAHTAARRTH